MKKLRSQMTYEPQDKHNEHPVGKSMTVPDESYTIAEILQRSQNGLSTDLIHQGEYTLDTNSENFDDYDIEKLKQLDPYDREMLARDLKQKNDEHKAYLAKWQQQKDADDKEAEQQQEDARIASFLERQTLAAKKTGVVKNKAEGGTTGAQK